MQFTNNIISRKYIGIIITVTNNVLLLWPKNLNQSPKTSP